MHEAQPASALAEFREVSKTYGNVTVVDRMCLEIGEGEFLAIMGPSGCGKTTTLRMLAGLETVTSGDILIDGRSTLDLAPYERDTPMVWQSLALFPFMSVEKNVEFGLKMRGVPQPARRTRVAGWLERLEIADLAKRNIATLSGGQRQRVALARSLVMEPRMLLLDEPLTALDASLVLRMQSVLTALQRDLGITFVYVTHSHSEAFAMADRVAIMHEGRLRQVGSPKEIYREPASRFVAEFVGLNNILTGRVGGRAGGRCTVATPAGRFMVDVPAGANFRPGDAVTFVVAAGDLRLETGASRSENRIRCVIVSEEFVGATVVVLLEAESGDDLKIQLPQRDFEASGLSAGSTAFVTWSPGDAHILPRE